MDDAEKLSEPTEALAAVERLTRLADDMRHPSSETDEWFSAYTNGKDHDAAADLALLLALLKEAGKVLGPFVSIGKATEEVVFSCADLPAGLVWPQPWHFRAAAKLAELLPSMEGE